MAKNVVMMLLSPKAFLHNVIHNGIPFNHNRMSFGRMINDVLIHPQLTLPPHHAAAGRTDVSLTAQTLCHIDNCPIIKEQ